MRFLLDTNACIAVINRSSPSVIRRLLAERPEDVVTSVICAAELRFGAERSARRQQALEVLETFLAAVRPVPFDVPCLELCGRVRSKLVAKGKPVGPLDTLIAAHALSLDLTLVTRNVREFLRVPELRVEDWSEG